MVGKRKPETSPGDAPNPVGATETLLDCRLARPWYALGDYFVSLRPHLSICLLTAFLVGAAGCARRLEPAAYVPGPDGGPPRRGGHAVFVRSEERRVGKEWRLCVSRTA